MVLKQPLNLQLAGLTKVRVYRGEKKYNPGNRPAVSIGACQAEASKTGVSRRWIAVRNTRFNDGVTDIAARRMLRLED
ncbi:MAG: hypothetical protein HS108_12290 [Planctomycetes bacterium]|nr:hypothetical protein [Planctomycetota bacterium]